MTERINTTDADFTSDTFSPEGDFLVQVSIPGASTARIDVEGRVDAGAEWIALAGLAADTNPPILWFAKVPEVRLRLSRNDGGATVKAWSGE